MNAKICSKEMLAAVVYLRIIKTSRINICKCIEAFWCVCVYVFLYLYSYSLIGKNALAYVSVHLKLCKTEIPHGWA